MAAWLGSVRAQPNERYASEYEARLEAEPSWRIGHEQLQEAFETAVHEVSGYALGDYRSPPRRGAEWWRRWRSGGAGV